MEFRKDVVIDLICYRRRGHNEAEEPMKTQPLMYQKIRTQNTVCASFSEKMVADGVVQAEAIEAMTERYRTRLESGESVALELLCMNRYQVICRLDALFGFEFDTPADTRFDSAAFQELSARMESLPDGFVLHRQVSKISKIAIVWRQAMSVNWGMAGVRPTPR